MKIKDINLEEKTIELIIEQKEDLYYLSLILDKNDIVYAWTWRQIRIETGMGKSEKGERARIYLGIVVEKLEFQKFTDRLRILGKVIEAPEYLHIKGHYHTLSLQPVAEVKIIKKNLPNIYLRILEKAARRTYKNLLICIGDQETVFSKISKSGIEIIATIACKVVKHDKGKKSYTEEYHDYWRSILEEIKFLLQKDSYDRVIIAAPALLEDFFRNYLARYQKELYKKAMFLNVTEGGLSGIYELVRDGKLAKVVTELKLNYEKNLVDQIFKQLEKGERRVAIGLREVIKAAEIAAIEKLLITDTIFFELKANEEFSYLLDNIEKSKGEIIIISDDHEHGIKLKSLGGIVAFLYFPVFS